MMRGALLALPALLVLASCGGGGGGGEPAPAQQLSGPSEFTRCEVPEQISFVRENEGAAGWQTNRYVKYPGQPLAKMVAGNGLPTAKNPEGVVSHGPLHAQNCTPGAGAVQTQRLRLTTEGYFGTNVVDHLFFQTRSNYPTFNAAGQESYQGIGMIMFPFFGGVMGERFGIPTGNHIDTAAPPQPPLRDGATYLVELRSTPVQVDYRVTLESTGETTGWKNYTQPADRAPLTGTGFAFAVLCADSNGRCEAFNQVWRVDIRDLAIGWE